MAVQTPPNFRPVFMSVDEAMQAAIDLKAMGPVAIRMLTELVEHQDVERKKPSPTAEALYDAGFAHVTERSYERFSIRPSLWGEEALAALETGWVAEPSPMAGTAKSDKSKTFGEERLSEDDRAN